MKIYGVDFHSSPGSKHPIRIAAGVYKKSTGLTVRELKPLRNFGEFEAFLESKGPWFAGMNFPFGLPQAFCDKFSFKGDWAACVRAISKLGKEGFEKKIDQYFKRTAQNRKELLRITDVLTQAPCPTKPGFLKSSRMFFEGTPRLLKSGASILPVRPQNNNRTVIETRPERLMQWIIGEQLEKHSGGKPADLLRAAILNGGLPADVANLFGFEVALEDPVVQAIEEDPACIISLCSLIQAAWAHRRGKNNYGIPSLDHPVCRSEGWIADPALDRNDSTRGPSSTAKAPRQTGNGIKVSLPEEIPLMTQIKRLSDIGRALSGHFKLPALLETIIKEARNLTHADGGTLYILENNALHFKIVQNDSLNINMGGINSEAISFPPVEMNESHVSTFVAMNGVTVNIPDVYHYKGFDFTGPKEFDRKTGYRTRSMLVVPMRNYADEVIGVLQLLNARSHENGEVVNFSEHYQGLVESLASLAAVAISNASLVADLKKANRELVFARDKALDASRAKSSFLANMSHELRTPMNAIIGYSEMLMEDAIDQELPEFESDLKKINVAGKHLLNLINQVLDLSKVEAGKMELYLEDIHITDLVQEVMTTIQPMAEENNNQLVIQCHDDLGMMKTDITRVRQILFNLLSNACKFTEKGTVTLDIQRQSRNGIDWMTYSIIDTGIGISPFEINKLFADFTQVDPSTTRKFGGTGLGLSISRRFCRMMGGDITVKSQPGKGSTFTVDLPVHTPSPAHPKRRLTDVI